MKRTVECRIESVQEIKKTGVTTRKGISRTDMNMQV